MNSGSSGSFNRLRYDNCAYQKSLFESTSHLGYELYSGKFENNQKCTVDNMPTYKPFDLVDIETELRNINRAGSRCPQFKYNQNCKKTANCTNTFDQSVPVVFPPEICPIVNNNIPKMYNTGLSSYENNVPIDN
jgi:hypothetical protein